MCKFIVEYKDNKYVMSFIDDYLPIETPKCDSLDESMYEMTEIFKDRSRSSDKGTIESMRELNDRYSNGRIPVELIGINLMNSDSIRELISNKFGIISKEYMEFINN